MKAGHVVTAAIMALLVGCTSPQSSDAHLTDASIRNEPAPGAPHQEDGFVVRVYPDGSGAVAYTADALSPSWSIDCRVDGMTDRRRCSISRRTGGPFIFYGFNDEPQSVCILGHNFPGRRGQIRVDSHPPITTDNEGCVPARRILEQMRAGESVLTRRYEWPRDYGQDHTTELRGLAKAMEVVADIRAGRRPQP